MKWLGYDIYVNNDQMVTAILFGIGGAIFGKFCGNKLNRCILGGLIMYMLAVVYVVNENAMYQLKAEFCVKHPEVDRCHRY